MDTTKSESNLDKEKEGAVLISWTGWSEVEPGIECAKKVALELDKPPILPGCVGGMPPTIAAEALNLSFGWVAQKEGITPEQQPAVIYDQLARRESQRLKPISGVIFNSELEQEIMRMFENIVASAVDEIVEESRVQNDGAIGNMLDGVIETAEKEIRAEEMVPNKDLDIVNRSIGVNVKNLHPMHTDVIKIEKESKEADHFEGSNKITLEQNHIDAMQTAYAEFIIDHHKVDSEKIFACTAKIAFGNQDEGDNMRKKCDIAEVEPTDLTHIQKPEHAFEKSATEKSETMKCIVREERLKKDLGPQDDDRHGLASKDKRKKKKDATYDLYQDDAIAAEEKELREAARQYVQDIIIVSLQKLSEEKGGIGAVPVNAQRDLYKASTSKDIGGQLNTNVTGRGDEDLINDNHKEVSARIEKGTTTSMTHKTVAADVKAEANADETDSGSELEGEEFKENKCVPKDNKRGAGEHEAAAAGYGNSYFKEAHTPSRCKRFRNRLRNLFFWKK